MNIFHNIVCFMTGHYWIKPFDEDDRWQTKCIRCGKRHTIMGPVTKSIENGTKWGLYPVKDD